VASVTKNERRRGAEDGRIFDPLESHVVSMERVQYMAYEPSEPRAAGEQDYVVTGPKTPHRPQ